MSRSHTLPLTWLKDVASWGTRSLHETLRQRPLFQIATFLAKWKFIQLWRVVMWFSICDLFPPAIESKTWHDFRVPFIESELTPSPHSGKKEQFYMGGQKVLWNPVWKRFLWIQMWIHFRLKAIIYIYMFIYFIYIYMGLIWVKKNMGLEAWRSGSPWLLSLPTLCT